MPKTWQLNVGYILLVVGYYLTAWGVYLAPQSSPTPYLSLQDHFSGD
ncbi:hypothetical protein J7M02_04915 [Candidatus Aerophobetes bacterium]|nr:hypothetical protein [Candidatus Aerophobetes bacterium]